MKNILVVLLCVAFLGCASGSQQRTASTRSEHEEIMSALDNVINEKNRLDMESKQAEVDLDLWEKECEQLKNRELNFIRELTDDQLRAYSDYEESFKSGNVGKTELHFRDLVKVLSKEQQLELVHLSQSANSLEITKKDLVRKNQEIAKSREENYRALNVIIHVAESYYGRRGRQADFSDVLYGVQQSMQQWQQNIDRNQQRLEVQQISSSLRDIANALQQFKY